MMPPEGSLSTFPVRQNPAGTALRVMAGWIVPGLGHLLLRRWGRALGFFLASGGLTLTGLALRGKIFSPHSDDAFGALGFIADLGSGIFYFLARIFETAGPDLSHASGDYGTRFLAASGIVNLLGLIDAFGIARGRRS
jgi:hypothetical protein